jgi:hypothetical protein
MTGRRLAAATLAGCVLLTLSGCPADGEPAPGPTLPSGSAAPPRPALPTNASTDLPAYGGPPGDAPASAGPLTRVRAAVDLTPATPGVFARLMSAVATPDGGAYALLSPADPDVAQALVTVRGDAIAGTVPLPRVEDVWGMHLLADGSVLLAGRFGEGGYGLRVVDPATGAVRTTVVVPPRVDVAAVGRSALLSGGATAYLFFSVDHGGGARERLAAVDVASGRFVAERNVGEDVAAASRYPVGRQLGGLVARPGGGATLVFDASPTEVAEDRIPTVLTYDAELERVGEPVRVTDLAEGAETQSVAGAADGTVFLLVAVRDGAWLLAVPDGGGAGPLLAQLEDHVYGYALAVEAAQVWAVLPAPTGALAVDLTAGETRGPLPIGCAPRLDVRDLYPASGGALMIGECDTPREDTQMLWFLSP